MATLRTAFRAAPRAQIPRSRCSTQPATLLQRTYASESPRPATDTKPVEAAEQESEDLSGDPNMNGNYPDPNLTSALPIKRQFRDPYADWWDPIERRNYGETIHEDNDILGVFTTEAYTHFTPGWGAVLVGCFVAGVGALMGVVYQYYPDRPSAPRTFPGGLGAELGGPGAVRARMSEDEEATI